MSSTKARIVLIVTSILAIVVVAILLVRVRHPMAVASIAPYTGTPAASLPLGTRRPNIPPPKVGNTSTVQVCGYGQLPIEGDDTSAIFQQVGALTKGASTRWMAALQNSGDLRARVAGLLLEGKVTGGDSLRPVAEQTRNEVVQLAAGSVDPAVYGMALSMCETSAGTDMDSACRQLTLRRWAQIDPDNAVPWLLLAGAARARHDSVAEADAFTHAATAHRVDSYSDSVFAFAEPELPHDVTPLERSYLATEVIGVESGIRLPQYSAVSRHCSSSAMQDGAVRQQCDLIAELLVTQGTNFLDLGLGRSIGERVGWSSERVNQLARERDALTRALMQVSASDNDSSWTCSAVGRMNAYVQQRVRLGELGAARDALERSGETVEALAHKYAQYEENIRSNALRQAQEMPPDNTQ